MTRLGTHAALAAARARRLQPRAARGAAPPAASVAPPHQVLALEAASSTVQSLLRRAREARDPERAACLDELLSRAHVAARYGRSLREAIDAAARRGDTNALDVEARRLGHLGERGGRLVALAHRCGSPSVVAVTGGTVVRVIAPPLPDAAAYPSR